MNTRMTLTLLVTQLRALMNLNNIEYFDEFENEAQIWYYNRPSVKQTTIQKAFNMYNILATFNLLYLTIFAYTSSVGVFGIVLTIIIMLATIGSLIGLFLFFIIEFKIVARFYIIAGYKSMWLFITALFIPQICCAVCMFYNLLLFVGLL